MAARYWMRQLPSEPERPNNPRPRLPRVTSCNCPARESSKAHSRHTADQSPLRRRIHCCPTRDLFFSFSQARPFSLFPSLFLALFPSHPLFRRSVSSFLFVSLISSFRSVRPPVALPPFSRRGCEQVREKENIVVAACAINGTAFDPRIDSSEEGAGGGAEGEISDVRSTA